MTRVKPPGSAISENPNQKGPNSKLTEETHTQVVNAVRAGNYLEVAAAYAGITKETLHLWLRKGRAADTGPYREFVDEIDQALASAEVRDLALIGQAATEEWQAAAWRLERKFPDRYGRRTRVDSHVEHAGTVMLQARPMLDVSRLTPAEQAEFFRLFEKASPSADELGEGERPALELLAGDA